MLLTIKAVGWFGIIDSFVRFANSISHSAYSAFGVHHLPKQNTTEPVKELVTKRMTGRYQGCSSLWQANSGTELGTISSTEPVTSALCSCLLGDCCHRKRLSSERLSDGQTCLHLVCQDRTCSVTTVRKLLAEYPGALERRNDYGRMVRTFFPIDFFNPK